MQDSTYKVYDAEVFVYNGDKAIMADSDFSYFLRDFNRYGEHIKVKISNKYIPVYPSSSIPTDTIAITERQSNGIDVEGEDNAVLVTDPTKMKWL